MLENDAQVTPKTFYKPDEIIRLNKWMKNRVALVIRLRDEGKIPCASRIPRCHVQRRDIPMILGISYSDAGRVIAYVRQDCKLKPRQYISIENFCKSTGLSPHEVQRSLDMCPMLRYWKDDPDKKK